MNARGLAALRGVEEGAQGAMLFTPKNNMTMMKKMMTINNSAERENSHGAIVL